MDLHLIYARLYEDNGGTLHLFSSAGYHHSYSDPKQAAHDVTELLKGSDVADWEGNQLLDAADSDELQETEARVSDHAETRLVCRIEAGQIETGSPHVGHAGTAVRELLVDGRYATEHEAKAAADLLAASLTLRLERGMP